MYALLHPLLKNSIPIAPLPANKSNTTESSILLFIILNKDSLTLSSVGLVEILSIEFNFVPLAFPTYYSHIYSHLSIIKFFIYFIIFFIYVNIYYKNVI